jgi:hypothetical protein
VGISIGVAVFPTDGTDASTLVRNADAALYRAKSDGRATIRFFEAEMDKRLRKRRALHQELRSALDAGQFSLEFHRRRWSMATSSVLKRCCGGGTLRADWSHPWSSFRWPKKAA